MEQTNGAGKTDYYPEDDMDAAAVKLAGFLRRWHALISPASPITDEHWLNVATSWCSVLHKTHHCLNEDIERGCWSLDEIITNTAIYGSFKATDGSLRYVELRDLIKAGADGSWRMK